MSLILDALNKAETERQQVEETPGLDSQHELTPPPPSPLTSNKKLIIAIVASTIIVVAIALIVTWSTAGSKSKTPLTPASAPASSSKAINPANLKKPPVQPAVNPLTTPTPALAAHTQKQERAEQQKAINTVPAQPTIAPSAALPVTTVDNASKVEVEALYKEKLADKNKTPTATETSASDNHVAQAPAQVETNIQASIEAATPAQVYKPKNLDSLANYQNIGTIRSLNWTMQEAIPSLHYDEHEYSPNGKGYVVINGKRVGKNQTIAKDLVLEKVLKDGIILSFQGNKFKMQALNTWINM